MSVLAVDLGTGSVKVALVDDELRVLASRVAALRGPRLPPRRRRDRAAASGRRRWRTPSAPSSPRRREPPLRGRASCGQMHGRRPARCRRPAPSAPPSSGRTRARRPRSSGWPPRPPTSGPASATRSCRAWPGRSSPCSRGPSRSRCGGRSPRSSPRTGCGSRIAGPERDRGRPQRRERHAALGRPGQPLGRRGLRAPRRRSRPAAAGARLARRRRADHGRARPAARAARRRPGPATPRPPRSAPARSGPGAGCVSVGTGAQVVVPLAAPTVPGPHPVTHTYRSALPVGARAAGTGWARCRAPASTLERVLGWLGAGWDEALAAVPPHPRPGGRPRVPAAPGGRADAVARPATCAAPGPGSASSTTAAALLRAALTGVACAIADAWDAVAETGADAGVPLLVGGGSVRPRVASAARRHAPDAAAPGRGAGRRGARRRRARPRRHRRPAISSEAAERLGEIAVALGRAALVEPRIDTIGWILEVRARFEDARHRLA